MQSATGTQSEQASRTRRVAPESIEGDSMYHRDPTAGIPAFLDRGEVPSANVTAIFKKGSRKDPSNYLDESL